MSVREKIAENLVETLSKVVLPLRIKKVTREPFDFKDLSNAQYPAVLVRSAGEEREQATIGGSMSTRMGSIDYDLICYVKGSVVDTARNDIIEAVEEGLDVDRLRGGYALDTQVTRIEVDDGAIQPIGGVIITVRVEYEYTRGIT